MAKAPTSGSHAEPGRTTAEELAEQRAAIDRLTDAVGVLIDAVDRLTDEVQWRNNQLGDRFLSLPPVVLTSMPKDPTAKDWQINRVRPDDLPPEEGGPSATSTNRPCLTDCSPDTEPQHGGTAMTRPPSPARPCPNCGRADKVISVGGQPFCDRCCGFLSYWASAAGAPAPPAPTVDPSTAITAPPATPPAPVSNPSDRPSPPSAKLTMDIRDLSCLERTATLLEELIQACRKMGPLYTRNPKLVADVTRKAKALHTCLTTLRQFLEQPQETSP